MRTQDDLELLWKKMLDGHCTPDEMNALIDWLGARNPDHKTHAFIRAWLEEPVDTSYLDSSVRTALESRLQAILSAPAEAPVYPIRSLRKRIGYAAAVVLFIGMAAFLYLQLSNKKEKRLAAEPVYGRNDFLPGSNKAFLTLSDGRKIILDSTAGERITDGKIGIVNKNGVITYSPSDILVYNTLTTPRGGQYRVKLPDGTNVWLNAASSITYATSFPGNERRVSITGEAYFEVTKDPLKPFRVKTYNDEITVLGTSFNVSSYSDEPTTKTSLLEGSVRINGKILKPGQAYTNGQVVKTNLEQDLAWKNGLFNFEDKSLDQVMRQLARWYDFEVEYPEGVPRIEFGGELKRDLLLPQILKALESSKVHFKLTGHRIIIAP